MKFQTLYWQGDIDGRLILTDQRKLPSEFCEIICLDIETLFDSIKTLALRGAPAIGVGAAYGVCLHMKTAASLSLQEALAYLNEGADSLATSRPTAVNLFWALDRIKKTASNFVCQNPEATCNQLRECILLEAKKIDSQDKQMCEDIGRNGLRLIEQNSKVLTHCNAGALATAGVGTALAPMYAAQKAGIDFKVYVDETRPLLQGARLTSWELARNGIDVTVVCDSMAGWLMIKGMIDLIIVGADRIAANGDVANKIGTYSLSVLAKHHNIPFYVAAPTSTFDLSLENGALIPIEQRSGLEISCFNDVETVASGVNVFNPSFDVTPATNITAIITERALIEDVSKKEIAKVVDLEF